MAAQKRTLGGRELQLPCMSSLTSKTSTQKFFLRVLQVIIQLREDTRRANKKAKQTGRIGSTTHRLVSGELTFALNQLLTPPRRVQAHPVWARPAVSRLRCGSWRLRPMPSSRWCERVSGLAASSRVPCPPPPPPQPPQSPPGPRLRRRSSLLAPLPLPRWVQAALKATTAQYRLPGVGYLKIAFFFFLRWACAV